jgi:hypothetical protein
MLFQLSDGEDPAEASLCRNVEIVTVAVDVTNCQSRVSCFSPGILIDVFD